MPQQPSGRTKRDIPTYPWVFIAAAVLMLLVYFVTGTRWNMP